MLTCTHDGLSSLLLVQGREHCFGLGLSPNLFARLTSPNSHHVFHWVVKSAQELSNNDWWSCHNRNKRNNKRRIASKRKERKANRSFDYSSEVFGHCQWVPRKIQLSTIMLGPASLLRSRNKQKISKGSAVPQTILDGTSLVGQHLPFGRYCSGSLRSVSACHNDSEWVRKHTAWLVHP